MLAEREKEILKEIKAGKNYKEIAGEMGISRHTVKAIVCLINKKLGVTNKIFNQ